MSRNANEMDAEMNWSGKASTSYFYIDLNEMSVEMKEIDIEELSGKYVYLAGPYANGDKEENAIHLTLVSDRLMDHGVIVFNPLLSHHHHAIAPRPVEFWYQYDLKWLDKCDVMLFLPGESKGVNLEICHAVRKGIPVYPIEAVRGI